jgi:predicted amidophosphoribosyltransferase
MILFMSKNEQHCPVCQKSVQPSQRYPHYLCTECASKAKSKDGRLLRFGNESWSGGFVASYADTGEPYPSHECYIEGIACYADEHHMGGIVIKPV